VGHLHDSSLIHYLYTKHIPRAIFQPVVFWFGFGGKLCEALRDCLREVWFHKSQLVREVWQHCACWEWRLSGWYSFLHHFFGTLTNTKTTLEDTFNTLQDHSRESRNMVRDPFKVYMDAVESRAMTNAGVPMMKIDQLDLAVRVKKETLSMFTPRRKQQVKSASAAATKINEAITSEMLAPGQD
jgi:hypothetical protein